MNPDRPQQPAHRQQAQAASEAEQDQEPQHVPAASPAAETDNNRDDESLIEADEVSSPLHENTFISARVYRHLPLPSSVPPRPALPRPVPPRRNPPFAPLNPLADPLRLQEHRIFADADSTLGDDV
jgi:hypothetical protein